MSKALVIKGANFSANKLTTVVLEDKPCTGIALSEDSITLTDYTPVTLVATVTPADTTDSVVWSSSDTNVATVNNGVVTAIGFGTCTITATCGTQSDSADVTVALAYIEAYKFGAYSHTSGNSFVSNGAIKSRVGCYGSGQQAGVYISPMQTTGIDVPIIKLPKGTASITIKFSGTMSLLSNSNDAVLFWMKDVWCGADNQPTAALLVEGVSAYNPRTYSEKTFNVPDGADGMLFHFRLDATSEEELASTVAAAVGFSLTFNATAVN